MYKGLIKLHFRCCCPAWGTAGITALRLKNRAARIVTNIPYDAHSELLIQELEWLIIKQLIESETAKVVYKALHSEAPDYLKRLFHTQSSNQILFYTMH